ncbi:SRPBCC domain-containing protein [Flammeovirgaceae bacterium SG7u.111]|nr:SRPBCC domain-containing protein [Flammeovirgaceae bacterium SG7u.132]WPO34991.1 SRPBCC domain-containing protein [Flammeovirgaceae bacterium SG7u.111]
MNDSMVFKEEVIFQASPEQVWGLLTNPAMTKQYMFGCEVISSWNIGSPIHWKGVTEDGKEVVYVKGTILEYEENKRITFSMFDPNMGIADIPTNYVNMTYSVISNGLGTALTITQGDFAGADNAEQRFEESKKGWEMVIPLMRKVLEG